MKTVLMLISSLFFTCSCSIAAEPETGKLSDDQISVLLAGTVVPRVKSYCDTNTAHDSLDVLIVESPSLQKKFSESYAGFDDCLKFENEKEVVYGSKRNVHKPTGLRAYVNKFRAIIVKKDEVVVEWDRTVSPIGGSVHEVTMQLRKGLWVITKMKLTKQS